VCNNFIKKRYTGEEGENKIRGKLFNVEQCEIPDEADLLKLIKKIKTS